MNYCFIEDVYGNSFNNYNDNLNNTNYYNLLNVDNINDNLNNLSNNKKINDLNKNNNISNKLKIPEPIEHENGPLLSLIETVPLENSKKKKNSIFFK